MMPLRRLGDVVLIRVFLAMAIGLALAACATIIEGTTQIVAVDTPGVPGATCTLSTKSGPQVVATPGTVSLKKGPDPIPISCVKPCYVHELSIIRSSSESMPTGDLVSLAIDSHSGAMYHYPDTFTVSMTPDSSSLDPVCIGAEEPPPPPEPPPKRTSSAQQKKTAR